MSIMSKSLMSKSSISQPQNLVTPTNITNRLFPILDQIQIVMVNTTLPANIGSAARAMHTMGLSNLTVVQPKLPVDETSYSHAAGATHILDNINIVNTLDEAIADSQLVFAASSRSRTMPRPVVNPTEAAQLITQFLTSFKMQNKNDDNNAQISILFGREDRGLTNDELAVAQYHIQIDANPNYPVLNVASAVQVISSFIYSHVYHLQNKDDDSKPENNPSAIIHQIRQQWDSPAITYQQLEQLNSRIVELMQSLNLADSEDLGLLPQRLNRLTSRIQLDEKEYQMLSAIVGKLAQQIKLAK